MPPDAPTPVLALLAAGVSILASLFAVWLLTKRLRMMDALRLRQLRSEHKRLEMERTLELVSRLRRKYEAAEAWLRVPRPEQARAARLTRIPQSVRILFEDLDSQLNYLEASPSVDIEENQELKAAFCKALVRSAALALELDNPANAVRRIRRALEFGEDYISRVGEDLALVYYVLGTAYMAWGAQEHSEDELSSAVKNLERSLLIRQTTKALFNLAWTYDELARVRGDSNLLEKAIELLGRIPRDDDFYAAARYNMACCLVKLGRYEAALRSLTEIPDGDDGDALWALARTDEDLAPLRSHGHFGRELQELLDAKFRKASAVGAPS